MTLMPPLADVAKLPCDARISFAVVCNPGGTMAGVITKTNVVRQIAHGRESRGATTAAAVMTRDIASPERPVAQRLVANERAWFRACSDHRSGFQASWRDYVTDIG